MNKQFVAVLIVVFAALFGVFALTSDKKDSKDNNNTSASASNHVVGNPEAKVELVEYGDFQCPACKSYFPIVAQIKEDYKDRIKFQFRHFPLVQIHPNAFITSRAAEAAGKQGKFYEMHDTIYQNQDQWAQASNVNQVMESYASQLQLDMEKFKADLSGAEVAGTINADVKAGQALGVSSTPTFVLNGKKINQNPKSLEEFKKLIDDELAKNQ